ncbi:hypothetical protein QTJ16_004047 [Diplocarpon rosae]|uniref:BZIP domain-containing protein n=1 Tax=Diplocarpon rosae TaxID=946125 RepID=A0AAD9T1C8_9HELO|nr:hypothetical protein QTJ16_004047 [Diplocarpon rosae]
MDSSGDKEERKRENLEQAQREQSSEQSEEIERLRYQNEELRRENEALRAQMYASPSSSSHLMSSSISAPSLSGDARRYSLSPSLSGTSISGAGSPPATLAPDMMPMAALSLTSSMLLPSMHPYADPSTLPAQPYSLVHPSGLRQDGQSSPESPGFRDSRPPMGPAFQALNASPPDARAPPVQGGLRRRAPYDRTKARTEILEAFCFYSDPSVTSDPQRHLAVRTMSASLPSSLEPSQAQLARLLTTCGIDMIASPWLRERLMTLNQEVARGFVAELGVIGGEGSNAAQLIFWGDDALNEAL